MSGNWIKGRFTGIYTGQRLGSRHARRSARRFTFQLVSGSVLELARAGPPEAEGREDATDEIRQDRLDGVALPLSTDGTRAGSLFDVRIRDYELSHPAEVRDRGYGTITGTIRARLPPGQRDPGPPGSPVDAAVEERLLREPDTPPRRGSKVETADTPVVLARLRLALAVLLIAVVAIALGLMCDARTAAIYAAPLVGALLLRRATRSAPRTRSLEHWWGTGIIAVHLLALSSTTYGSGCYAATPNDLLVLAAPVLISGLLSLRWPLVACAGVWTAAVCSACFGLGTCGASGAGALRPTGTGMHASMTSTGPAALPAAAALPFADAKAQLADARTRRTDSSGRWPVMPSPASGAAPASDESVAAVPGESSAPGRMPPSGGTGRSTRLPAEPASARAASHGASTPGGWVAADHRRSPRELVLISIEHANRTPDEFFAHGESRRVYIPSDPIFGATGAEIGKQGELHLSRLAALLALQPARSVTLEVHTDVADWSRRLSMQRAAALRSWLLDRGHLKGDRFEVVGLGDSRPLVPADGSHAAQHPNRRIEVRLRD